MKHQTLIIFSTLLHMFALTGNASTSGGSGGGGISIGTNPDSYVGAIAYVQPGDWRQASRFEKISLSSVNGSAAAGNASASASVDLPLGLLSAYANAGNDTFTTQTAVSSVNVNFRDKFTVISSSPFAKAVLHAELNGGLKPGFGDETMDYARFDLGVSGPVTSLQRIDGLFTVNPVSYCMPVFDGYPIDCVAGDKTSYKTEITFELPYEGATFQIFGTLAAQATNGSVIDFTNGYKFWLEVPQGTQLQSLQGFPVTQVPEPSQYAFLLAGISLLLLRKFRQDLLE